MMPPIGARVRTLFPLAYKGKRNVTMIVRSGKYGRVVGHGDKGAGTITIVVEPGSRRVEGVMPDQVEVVG